MVKNIPRKRAASLSITLVAYIRLSVEGLSEIIYIGRILCWFFKLYVIYLIARKKLSMFSFLIEFLGISYIESSIWTLNISHLASLNGTWNN